MAYNWRKIFGRKSPVESIRSPRRAIGYSSGETITEDTAMKVAAFYRGINYISTQIAKLPWDVKDKDNNVINDSVSTLLSLAPNSETNTLLFRATMIQNALIKGNAYAEIERTKDGRPTAIWQLPTEAVELVRRLDDGKLLYKCNNLGAGGVDIYLEPKNVYHIRNSHTKDGLLGQGIVSYAMDTLGISRAADSMAGEIFESGGVPSGILSHPGELGDPEYKRLQESWDSRKAGKTAILEDGVTYTAIEVDPQILQFLESRKFGVLEIARFLGLPPSKLFDQTTATFSNIENSNLEVATDTLDFWAVNLEMEADVKILNNRYNGKFSEIDLYSVFRGDMKTRGAYFTQRMQTGSITPNEIRRLEGFAPYPEGNRFFIASNNYTPADRIDEVLDAKVTKDLNPTNPNPGRDVTPTEETKQLEKAAAEFLKSVK